MHFSRVLLLINVVEEAFNKDTPKINHGNMIGGRRLIAKVSVIICVKDAENYISECIRSLLHQTFKNFEIVIIDDTRISNTKHILEKFDDNRIRYFKNEKTLELLKVGTKG